MLLAYKCGSRLVNNFKIGVRFKLILHDDIRYMLEITWREGKQWILDMNVFFRFTSVLVKKFKVQVETYVKGVKYPLRTNLHGVEKRENNKFLDNFFFFLKPESIWLTKMAKLQDLKYNNTPKRRVPTTFKMKRWKPSDTWSKKKNQDTTYQSWPIWLLGKQDLKKSASQSRDAQHRQRKETNLHQIRQ